VAGDRISKNAYKILIGRRQAEMALGAFMRLTRMEGRKQIPEKYYLGFSKLCLGY
jgi:hypothetical protein